MLKLVATSQFRKDFKIIQRRNSREIYRDHLLVGNYSGFCECHISSVWLLIYKIDKDKLILTVLRTKTHSDLF